jgi:hypothetical protein
MRLIFIFIAFICAHCVQPTLSPPEGACFKFNICDIGPAVSLNDQNLTDQTQNDQGDSIVDGNDQDGNDQNLTDQMMDLQVDQMSILEVDQQLPTPTVIDAYFHQLSFHKTLDLAWLSLEALIETPLIISTYQFQVEVYFFKRGEFVTLKSFDQNHPNINIHRISDYHLKTHLDITLTERDSFWLNADQVQVKIQYKTRQQDQQDQPNQQDLQILKVSDLIDRLSPNALSENELCQPFSSLGLCPMVSPCLITEQATYRCKSSNAPYLWSAYANRTLENQLKLSVRAMDMDDEITRINVKFLDQNDIPISQNGDDFTSYSYAPDEIMLLSNLLDPSNASNQLRYRVGKNLKNLDVNFLNRVKAVQLSVLDTMQQESNLIILPVADHTQLSHYSDCFQDYWGQCPPNLLCSENQICEQGASPEIQSAAVYVGKNFGIDPWLLRISYQDIDLNLTQIEIKGMIEQVISQDPSDHWLLPVIQRQAMESKEFSLTPPRNISRITHLQITLVDALNLSSDRLIIVPIHPIPAHINESCDPNTYQSFCTDFLDCYAPPYDLPANGPICLADIPHLNEGFAVIDTHPTFMPTVPNNRLNFQFDFDIPVSQIQLFRLSLESELGENISLNGAPFQDMQLNRLNDQSNRLTYYLNFQNRPVPAQVRFALVAFKDRRGYWTAQKRIPIFPIEILQIGDGCQPSSALSVCDRNQQLKCIPMTQTCAFYRAPIISTQQSEVDIDQQAPTPSIEFEIQVQNGNFNLSNQICFSLFDQAGQNIPYPVNGQMLSRICIHQAELISGSLESDQSVTLRSRLSLATCANCLQATQAKVWVVDETDGSSQEISFDIQD